MKKEIQKKKMNERRNIMNKNEKVKNKKYRIKKKQRFTNKNNFERTKTFYFLLTDTSTNIFPWLN